MAARTDKAVASKVVIVSDPENCFTSFSVMKMQWNGNPVITAMY